MANTFSIQSSSIGVDLNNQSTTQLFALGTHFLGTQDTEWVYVQANTSIVGQTMVAYNASFTCGMASGGDLTLGNQIGVAQTSISSQAFGWVAIRGVGLTIASTGTASIGAAVMCLAASAVATGVVSPVITASNTLAGVVLAATVSGSLAVVTLTWPRGFAQGG